MSRATNCRGRQTGKSEPVHGTGARARQSPRRAYFSPARAADVALVRRRIIEAVVRILSPGAVELTVPQVAREAGVSVRTVYRQFGSKAGLVAATTTYVGSSAERSRIVDLPSFDDLEEGIAALFRFLGANDAVVQSVLAGDVGRQTRRATMPVRLDAIRDGLRHAAPGLTQEQLERLTRLTVVLTSSFALRAFEDHFEFDHARAATEVAWAIRAAIAGASSA